MLLNKFDCLIMIEGNRGLGKSTFAFKLLTKISKYFRTIYAETGDPQYKDWYRFNPLMQLKKPNKNRYVIYTQKDVINFYDKWHVSAIGDEFINVAFNREFFGEDQKNLVKMINMNRDHGNLLIGCVPAFQTLDNQVKNLCKIRITVARRGLAVIQTPNRTIYNRDRWDSTNNERIEREWLKGGIKNPRYSKLTTFRGWLRFHKLTDSQEAKYQEVKDLKRNIIAQDKGLMDKQEEKEKDPFNIMFNKFVNKQIKSSDVFEGMCEAFGLKASQVKNKIRKRLKEEKRPSALMPYYYDPKPNQKEEKEDFDELVL